MKKIILPFLLLSLVFACQKADSNKEETQPDASGSLFPDLEGKSENAQNTGGVEEADNSASMSVANVVLTPQGKEPLLLTVEVAQTVEARRRGLQERENLPEKHGMWFVFDQDVKDPFWMKGTPIALDIIFVDKDMNIVDMIKKAAPNDESLLAPRAEYRYVLEVGGGLVDKWGVNVGDKVEFRLGPP